MTWSLGGCCVIYFEYFALIQGFKNYLALENTPSKRKSINAQRTILELESTKLKTKRSSYEEFDYDESRRQHDDATMEAATEHYQTLATTSKKKKKKKTEVI